MSRSLLIALCVVASAPAGASEPPAGTATSDASDPASLGRLDALLTLCARADADHSAVYERLRTEMIVFAEGSPYEVRVSGSDKPAYKAAYTAVLDAAAGVAPERQTAECRRSMQVDGAADSK